MKKINPHAKYFETNEWVRQDSDTVTIGITDFAQTVFGNVVLVEFDEVGKIIQKGDSIAILESNKTTTEICSPLSGKIIANNDLLLQNPELLNEDVYGNGWLIQLEMSNPDEYATMMSAEDYQDFIKIFYNKI